MPSRLQNLSILSLGFLLTFPSWIIWSLAAPVALSFLCHHPRSSVSNAACFEAGSASQAFCNSCSACLRPHRRCPPNFHGFGSPYLYRHRRSFRCGCCFWRSLRCNVSRGRAMHGTERQHEQQQESHQHRAADNHASPPVEVLLLYAVASVFVQSHASSSALIFLSSPDRFPQSAVTPFTAALASLSSAADKLPNRLTSH
jgi:hypothetical protein